MASQDRKFHYIWLADGTKVLDSETGINYKAYLGSLIYEYGTSQSKFKTEFENGTISFDEMTGQHEVLRYFKDHLGSVRVIMQNGRPAAFNEYEPFGRFEQEYSSDKFQNVTFPEAKNKFMFNGKEEFYNNAKPILNFGARMYDPTIARWNSVDPMAFLFQNHSPYNYCFNNPINYTDPSGMNPQEDEIEILTEIEHIIVTADRIRPSVSRSVSMLTLPRRVLMTKAVHHIVKGGLGAFIDNHTNDNDTIPPKNSNLKPKIWYVDNMEDAYNEMVENTYDENGNIITEVAGVILKEGGVILGVSPEFTDHSANMSIFNLLRDQYGRVYINFEGKIYEVTMTIHTHPHIIPHGHGIGISQADSVYQNAVNIPMLIVYNYKVYRYNGGNRNIYEEYATF